MSSGNWGPLVAVTKDEHDAIVAKRGRPLTADPMRAAERPDDGNESPSIFDGYLKGNR